MAFEYAYEYALVKCPDTEDTNGAGGKEITCNILGVRHEDDLPRQFPPNLVCTEPRMMKVKIIKCPPPDEGPIGQITRNQDLDLVASKFITRCVCGMRNGLDADCKRLSCRSNPGCFVKPWPKCWPKYKKPEPRIVEIEAPVQLCYVAEPDDESEKQDTPRCNYRLDDNNKKCCCACK